PTLIWLANLQGVGKTTVCAKLAFYLKKQQVAMQDLKPQVQRFIPEQQVSVDTFYTAGFQQLIQKELMSMRQQKFSIADPKGVNESDESELKGWKLHIERLRGYQQRRSHGLLH
ncbi:hypothetical protein CARUB_v10012781mg, partial [Capsella rubella]